MNEENRIDVIEYLCNRRDFAWNAFLKTGLPVYHGIAFRARRRIAALKVGEAISNSTRHLGDVANSLLAKVKSKTNKSKNDNSKNDNSLNLG